MPTILVIEDNPEVRENIIDILAIDEFDVIEATNGIEGVDLALSCSPDLILCDILMPHMDGMEVLARLRERSIDTPFIFLTAKAAPADTRLGMESGAEDYLTKPFTRSELLKSIATQLEKKGRRDKEFDFKLTHMQSVIHEVLPHELRTPLNGILANISLLKEMDLPDEAKELVDDIQKSALRQNRLTENWMSYYASETSKELGIKPLENSSSDLFIVGTKIASDFGIQYQRSQDVQCNLIPIPIALPSSALSKILACIVDNAFKFSAPGSPVVIDDRHEAPGYHRISVYNEGVGLTAEQIARIGPYMKFWDKDGLGLGLAIVQNICEQYKGRLLIESEPGSWIRVNVVLPVA